MDVTHAAGQFNHGQLASQGSAGRFQPGNHGGIVVELLVLEGGCAPSSGYAAARGQQVLGAPGYAVQQAPAASCPNIGFGLPGSGQGAVGGEVYEGVVVGTKFFQPVEKGQGQFDGRDFPAGNEAGQFPDGFEGEGVGHANHSGKV